jgi:hypothetical protein
LQQCLSVSGQDGHETCGLANNSFPYLHPLHHRLPHIGHLSIAHRVQYLRSIPLRTVTPRLTMPFFLRKGDASTPEPLTDPGQTKFASDVHDVAYRLLLSTPSIRAITAMYAEPWELRRPSKPYLESYRVSEPGSEECELVRAFFKDNWPQEVYDHGLEDWSGTDSQRLEHIFLRGTVSQFPAIHVYGMIGEGGGLEVGLVARTGRYR